VLTRGERIGIATVVLTVALLWVVLLAHFTGAI
jgi:hypothetical protein